MTTFTEDKLFKNIGSTGKIVLTLLEKESEEFKIWTKELRLLDPKDFIPDLIIELDFENMIVEFQSTPVNDEFSKRGLTYVAIVERFKENDKNVNLIVLSTAESSKTVPYEFGDESVLTYNVIGLKDLDANKIIEDVEPKIEKREKIEPENLVLYALVSIIVKNDIEKYINRVIDNLIQLENSDTDIINLVYGIEWLVVDKFIEDEETRNILCDRLGDRMSLIYEYGNRKLDEGIKQGRDEGMDEGIKKGRKEGMREVFLSLLIGGLSVFEISQKTNMSVSEINDILKD